jgi:hypothetical protein
MELYYCLGECDGNLDPWDPNLPSARRCGNEYYFLHMVSQENLFQKSISNSLYGCLVTSGKIINPNAKIIIYEIDSFKEITEVIIIEHELMDTSIKYTEDYLESKFIELIGLNNLCISQKFSERNNLIVVIYEYELKKYVVLLNNSLPIVDNPCLKNDIDSHIIMLKNVNTLYFADVRYFVSQKKFLR